MIKELLCISMILAISGKLFSQRFHVKAAKDKVTYSGFADAFYAYSFNEPEIKDIPYAYNHSRHNEFNVNLMLLNINYTLSKARANLGFQTGTYPKANYVAEPLMYQNIFQANAGISLSPTVWLDAGILPSHIGCESAISTVNWTLTRSLCAENSPYFETGARLTYSANSKWTFSALAVNGWQNIADNNSDKALGSQIVFVPNDKISINSSGFAGEGRNLPDSLKRMRYFHDLYLTMQLTEKLSAILLFDYGLEEKTDSAKNWANWTSPMLLLRLKPSEQFALCFRAEKFTDPYGVIVSTGTTGNYQVTGLSLNADFSPAEKVFFRVEGKMLSATDDIFPKGNSFSANMFLLTTSLAVGF